MALTVTPLTSDTTGGDAFIVTASITPTAGRRQFVGVSQRDTLAIGAPSSVVGNGLTWSLVDGRIHTSTMFGAWIYTAMGAPSTGTITVTFPSGDTGSRIAISVWEVAGEDGIVQSATDEVPIGSSAVSATLAPFARPDNGAFGWMAASVSLGAPVPGTGFTAIHGITGLSAMSALSEYQLSADTTVDGTWTGIGPGLMIALELAVAGAPPTPAGLVGGRWRLRARW